MIQFFNRLLFAWRFKRAVRKANNFHELLKMKFYVIIFDGKPVVVSKQNIKSMIHKRRFKKGVKPDDIERKALYVTP
ncbi:MAG: hypothetical protein HUK10_14530 [Bacteroides heparinolyticus]|nr:hypothetical protein [Bacteroides heparinolyticus]